jgi:hypothetical protein
MFGLFFRTSARRVVPQKRVRLQLESLEWRDQPDGTLGDPPGGGGSGQTSPNVAPVIVDFNAQEVGNGVFLVTGRVIDETPGGLQILFGGGTSAAGMTTTTTVDGAFSILITLRTDGTDSGFLTATATDPFGLTSEPVSRYLDPTS